MDKRVNFPASDNMTEEEAAEFIRGLDDWSLFPLPLPERPEHKQHRSARLRTRQKRRFEVWRGTSQLVKVLNALAQGAVSTKLTSPEAAQKLGHVKATVARSLALQRLLQSFAATARARRSLGLTGVQTSRAVATLLKQPIDDQGYMSFTKVKQVPLSAESLVEPSNTGCLDMLEALPQDDALFYSKEEHVIDTAGKSEALFK